MTADHWCLGYGGATELAEAASAYLAEGLSLGNQVGYFGWGDDDALRGRLGAMADLDTQMARGALLVTSLDRDFRPDEVPDPGRRLDFWSKATDRALEDGFAALRVVTDTTPWLDLTEQRAAFLRSEHLIDRYAVDHPLAVMCVCDRTALDQDALSVIGSIHARTEGLDPPFRLHATHGADLALAGEIDRFTAALLERTLTDLRGGEESAELIVDAGALQFIEHRGLITLERYAKTMGLTTVVLRDAPPSAAQLTVLLDLQHVTVEPAR